LELPKLQGSLPVLRTGIRWAGTYLTPQQRFSPEWTVTARDLRGKPIGPRREVRVGPKLELPKLQGSLPVLRTGIRWPGTYLGCQQGPRPERRLKPHGARAKPIGPGRQVRAATTLELPKLRGGPYCAADCHTVGTHVPGLPAGSEARKKIKAPWCACQTHRPRSVGEGRAKV